MLARILPAALLAVPAIASPAPVPAPAPEPIPAPVVPRAGSPSVWVTVNDLGESATTITPTVSGATTISAPPASLTKTSSWILTVTGVTTTSTGLPPVATDDGNAFLACSNYQGHVAPFCQPASGIQLDPDNGYFITWDPTYFVSDTEITIDGEYLNDKGFNFASIPSTRGYTSWAVGGTDFYSDGNTRDDQVNITFYMSYQDGNETFRLEGPNVLLTNKAGQNGGVGSSNRYKTRVLSIVLPIVLVLAAAALCGFCFWSYRRHGFLPFLGKIGRRSSGGYGERQNFAERTGNGVKAVPDNASHPKEASRDIQLTDQSTWSPNTGESNVFREELRRQEEERR